ncbi:hypothetical protein K439DRAFT_1642622 [Ramaria rubella]|nr:hypothetical protein K439DRAFT_1642622 [Ramaria rubella]
MRSQGLSGMTVPSGTATPPYSSSAYSHAETSTHPTHTSAHPPQKPANNNLPKSPSQTTTTPSTPNPRYAEHVGAAPSHTAASASLRAKTFPTPSSLNHALPTLKGLFLPIPSPTGSSFGNGGGSSSSPNGSTSRPGSRPSSPQHDNKKDIDPIADDNVSLGHRAAALLNLFRSSSRMSHNHDHHMSTLTSTTPVTLAPPVRTNGIGSPISPMLGADDTVRGKVSSPAPGPGHRSTFSVDWSMMNDGGANNKQSGQPSLPPPPRNPRRPGANNGGRLNSINTKWPDAKAQNATSHSDGEISPHERPSSPPHGPRTPPTSPPTSPPSIQGNSSHRGRRPSSANSASSYASAERDRASELDRASTVRRSRTVPKMLTPPNGPPPSAPSLRARSPSGPPSPILEQRINGSRLETTSSAVQTWGAQHPYSKRVSASSALSVNTASTGHSFLGGKPPPPPRPPPNFAPPPAPTEAQDTSPAPNNHRESFVPRSLRASLVPPAAPPTQSLPPRPDEPAYRHRRSQSSEVRPSGSLYPIPASPSHSSIISHPPAPPPPQGPLPPTPDSDRERPASRSTRHSSLTRRLRIISSPSSPSLTPTPAQQREAAARTSSSQDTPRRPIGEPIMPHSDGYPAMFLHMHDTPITPAIPQSPSFFLPSSPPQPEEDIEPTSLLPPPRRNSRNSKELRPHTEAKSPVPPLVSPEAFLEPQDSAVVLQES